MTISLANRPMPAAPTTVRACVQAVSAHYDIPEIELLSPRRWAPLVRARHIAMYLATRHTIRSLPEIGRAMAGRDHTTVLHGVRKIDQLIRDGDPVKGEIEILSEALTIAAQTGRIPVTDLPDPLVIAVNIYQTPGRDHPTATEIRAMAGYIIERALRAGELVIEGGETSGPDPELLPIERIERVVDPDLAPWRNLGAAVARTWRAAEAARFTRGESAARRDFEDAMKAFTGWIAAMERLPA